MKTPPGALPGRWKSEVRNLLLHLIETAEEAHPVAVFDWDNTCIAGDVGESALQWLDAQDGGDRMAHYEALIESHGKLKAYAWCAEAVGGRTEEALRALTWELWVDGLSRGTLVERPEIRSLVATLQRAGWEVWVVSASQETLVQVAAQRYGFATDRVIGMRLGQGADGVLRDAVEGPITFRAGKVEAIDARIGRRPHLAVGDAETDLEMLASARHGLWIDRGDPVLRAQAAAAGWWIQPAFETLTASA